MDNKTVGPKEGLGFGILAIGLLLAFIPGAAAQLSVTFERDPLAIAAGATYVIAFLIIVSGLVVAFGNYDKE